MGVAGEAAPNDGSQGMCCRPDGSDVACLTCYFSLFLSHQHGALLFCLQVVPFPSVLSAVEWK